MIIQFPSIFVGLSSALMQNNTVYTQEASGTEIQLDENFNQIMRKTAISGSYPRDTAITRTVFEPIHVWFYCRKFLPVITPH